MNAAVVDASVWVSRFVPQDVHHSVSRLWLERHAAAGDPLVVPVLALPEVAGAIARRVDDASLAHQALQAVLRLPMLRLVDVEARLARSAAQLAADHALRGADAVYVALALELGLPLVTLDREQRNRASVVLTTLEPTP
jgi:predicted nucleic acid-binding protein